MQLPEVLEVEGIRVLTTKQLAEMYGTDVKTIQYNFRYNKGNYILGKHYIEVNGERLRELKTRSEFPSSLKYAKLVYLWTEKGALLHAKSLNTGKAWQVYDYLVDFYFRAKEQVQSHITQEIVLKGAPAGCRENKCRIPHMDNPIAVLHTLLQVAEEEGIEVRSFPFRNVDSALQGKCIGIRQQLTMEKTAYELAWELAHLFIHYDAGNMIESPLAKEYNDQATRAAGMIIRMLNQKVSV